MPHPALHGTPFFLLYLLSRILPVMGRNTSTELTHQNLERNNITVCRVPDQSQWPSCVSGLRSHLISSFEGLIPSGPLEVSAPGHSQRGSAEQGLTIKQDGVGWEELPEDAVDDESGGCVRREKKKRVNFAREEVYDRCLDLIEDSYKGEPKWNAIWTRLFECVMTEKRGE